MGLEEIIEMTDEKLVIANGFDEAVIGYTEETDNKNIRIVYSVGKCLKILQERDGMGKVDSFEYFTFNVSGAYVGEKTPVWCWDV